MPARRDEGKNDGLDAVRIARSVLPVPVDRLRRPRAEQGARVAIRVLVVSREHLAADRTRTINISPHCCGAWTSGWTCVSP